jgi:hypothetical protein
MYQRLRNYLKNTALVLALLAGSSSFLQAQNWDKVIKAVAGDRYNRNSTARSQYDYYGRSVAISGDYAVVGANGEDEDENGTNYILSTGYGNTSAGAAYILRKENGNWKTVKKICAPVRVADDNFGWSVAIDGDYVVIGAQRDLGTSVSYSGAVYIFKKDQGGIDNWGFVKKIVTPNTGTDDNFGVFLAINGSYLAISAPMEDVLDGTVLCSFRLKTGLVKQLI